MWSISNRAVSSLRAGTRFRIRAVPGRTFAGDTGTVEFNVIDGSLTHDRNQQLSWSANLKVTNRLLDGRNALPFLDPRAGRTVWVYFDILFPDNVVETIKFPPLLVTTLKPVEGTLELTLIDTAQFFKDDIISHGIDSIGGVAGTAAAWINYITNLRTFTSTSIPNPTLVDSTGLPANVAPNPLVPDSRKVLDMADSIANTAGVQYGLWRNGTFLVRKRKVAGVDTSSWTFVDGADGVILAPVDYTIRREDYFNMVMASNPDVPAVTYFAQQGTGPLASYSDFGNRARYYASPILATGAQAAAAANTILAKAVTDRWALTITTHFVPHLDAGDVITIQLDGVGLVDRVISRITHPLKVGGTTQVETDAPALPDESAL